MKVVNVTRGSEIVDNLMVARRLWERCRGLLGKRNLERGEGLLIIPCNSIHTVFMRFPIDVLFLDRHLRVVKVGEEVKPYRFLLGPLPTRSVLELPVGILRTSGTRMGDSLSIIL